MLDFKYRCYISYTGAIFHLWWHYSIFIMLLFRSENWPFCRRAEQYDIFFVEYYYMIIIFLWIILYDYLSICGNAFIMVCRQNVDRQNVEQTKCRTDKMLTDKMPNRQNVDNFFFFFNFFFLKIFLCRKTMWQAILECCWARTCWN